MRTIRLNSTKTWPSVSQSPLHASPPSSLAFTADHFASPSSTAPQHHGPSYVPHLALTLSPSPSPSPSLFPPRPRLTPRLVPADRRPLVISGPSGVGKGTLYKLLFERHPETFALSVSHTTRAPRPGEQNAVDYHFVTHEAFEDLIARDGFVEHAKFGGNRYGTSKMTLDEQSKKGKVVVLDIEMEVCRLELPLRVRNMN